MTRPARISSSFDNPLRDAYILRINAEYADSVQLGRIVQELKTQDGVFEVQYVQSLLYQSEPAPLYFG